MDDEPIRLPSSGRFRLRLAAMLGTVLVTMLAARLHQLQVLEHALYQKKADRNTVAVELVSPPRGRIYDHSGRVLVSNQPRFVVNCVPAELKDRQAVCQALGEALGKPAKPLFDKVCKAYNEAPLERLELETRLDQAQLVRVTALARATRGLFVESQSIRRYPFGKRAAHLLGTVGEIDADELKELQGQGYRARDVIGKRGLEKQYDRYLKGHRGVRHLNIDVLGRTIRESQERRPIIGCDLHLSLDFELQGVAEAALAEKLAELKQLNGEDSAGAVVALEAQTGRVLALASLPQFDPRPFARGIEPKEYARLLADPNYPLLSRAFGSAFSPGSTFKLVTSSAALQQKLCTGGSVFYCGGSYLGASCFVRSGHGSISFEDSIAHSCDVVYYRLGAEMGIGNLRKFCALYGLGAPTGIDLPGEDGGLLPSPAWKEKWVGDEWYVGDTVNMSIGQGFLLVTPLQMAVVTAAVANGGKVVEPHLVDQIVDASGRVVYQHESKPVRKLPIDPKYLQSVRNGMRGAVAYGTSVAADSPLARVGGKTGTVENSPSVSNRHGRNHTWFVSFAPIDKPQIVVVAFLEKSGGYGGGNAAPVVRKVIDHYFGAPR